MRIGVIGPHTAAERRVPLTPSILGRLGNNVKVTVETGAGLAAGFPDAAYKAAGAIVSDQPWDVDALVTMTLTHAIADQIPEGAAVIGLLEPFEHPDRIEHLAARKISGIAFETLPRTTRAQAMDVLSSQATVLGYQAVLEAATRLPKFFPMLTTAAGTIRPAQVVVLGAGVAGLQAIATARRLGAVVSAFDVRAAAAEQVESLGARFIRLELEPQDASTSGGYARELADDDQSRLLAALEEHVVRADAVIATAAIPGRRAPLLVTSSMVEQLAPGSVVIDGAAATGGNCELTEPGNEIVHGGVTIVGATDLPSRTATHASDMFARNVFELLTLLAPEGELEFDFEDEIIDGVTVTHGGVIRNERVRGLLAGEAGGTQ